MNDIEANLIDPRRGDKPPTMSAEDRAALQRQIEAEEAKANQIKSVSIPGAQKLRPGSMTELPSPESMAHRRGTERSTSMGGGGSVVVRIDWKFFPSGEQLRLEVVSVSESLRDQFPIGMWWPEDPRYNLLSAMGVPLESGRVYQLTVQEHSSSKPEPRANPFKPGEAR